MKRRLLIGGIAVAAVLAIYLVVFFCLRGAVNKVPQNRIAHNIYIGDVYMSINVADMTEEEAKKALNDQVAKYAAEKVTLVADGQKIEATLGDFGLQMKESDTLVKTALTYGKTGSLMERYRLLKELKKEENLIQAEYIIDKEAVSQFLATSITGLDGEAVNATIKRENGQFIVTDGKVGKKIDVEQSFKAIEAYIQNDWKKTTNNQIALTITISDPDITGEALRTIKDVLGTSKTSYTGGGNRDKNIMLATSKISGALLMPGEEYSASEGMGPTDEEHGYFPGASYENGKVVQTYGGGVCQVSSTLYNAVLMSELEITERWAHSMLVSYVHPSMDAAIAEGYKDFKFKNNTEHPVYVEGVAEKGILTFTIYGAETRAENREVIYEHEIISEKPMQKSFVTSNAELGKKSIVEAGHQEMRAKLWKIVKENGVEVSRTNVNNSSYQGSVEKISVGINTDNAEAKKLVTDAVATQNEAKINEAIAAAKQLIKNAQNIQAPTEPAPPTTEGQ